METTITYMMIVSAREECIAESAQQTMFAAFNENKPVGFLCLKETGKATIEIQVMGVLKDYQRLGIGNHMPSIFCLFLMLLKVCTLFIWGPCYLYHR